MTVSITMNTTKLSNKQNNSGKNPQCQDSKNGKRSESREKSSGTATDGRVWEKKRAHSTFLSRQLKVPRTTEKRKGKLE
jgi:hypothetical protein